MWAQAALQGAPKAVRIRGEQHFTQRSRAWRFTVARSAYSFHTVRVKTEVVERPKPRWALRWALRIGLLSAVRQEEFRRPLGGVSVRIVQPEREMN